MRNRYLLGAGVALAVSMSWANAQAQLFAMPGAPGAWYFGGEGGWTSLDSPETGTTPAKGGAKVKESFADGYNVGARAGYEWGPWRFEEEFRFQQDGINRLSIGPASGAVRGNRDAYALMSNAIYDIPLGWPITPHIGAGVGAVILHDGVGVKGVGTFAHSTDVEFGYQGIAGVRYNINPSLAFDVDYRYLATTDPTFRFGGSGAKGFGVAGAHYTSGYSSSSLVASLSLLFGAPPPPPIAAPPMPPAPPPVSRQVFLVFFDWDRDTITPEGMQIIQQAAAAFRAGGPVTIQVTGYTDRSGSPGYNQRLSERRANNVANAMARMGVPRQQMAVSGRGENDNRVPTAPGVREPQNRRVEIVFP
jgi:outer membrane protein OmpA-like peptidoglycan-associated protein